jgi:hypothetical protein
VCTVAAFRAERFSTRLSSGSAGLRRVRDPA